MKFKLKSNPINVNSHSALQEYLRGLGINKVDSFIHAPLEEDEESYQMLTMLEEGLEMLDKHLEKGSSIYLQVDSDTDGYTSSAIIYSYLKEMYPYIDIDFDIHPEKEHGVNVEEVGFSYDLVIVPDAGSNQEELKELSNRSDILIIDHHIADVDISSEKIVVINNQTSPFFSNKSLSGAGMVYKFIQAHSDKHNLGDVYKKYIDLAAVGIVADSMDSRNIDNNYLIHHGLNNFKNPMLKALLEARSFSVSSTEVPTKIDIAFYVAPIINGLIRFGDMDEKREFFYALTDYHSSQTFVRIVRGEERVETIYQKVARESISVKTKQDNAVKKVLPILQNRIESNGLDKNKIIICKTSKTDPDEVPKTVTGLVAMKLSVIYNKPVLVLRPVFSGKDTFYAGSGRASAADGFDSFKDFLSNSGLVNYSAGHDMAFGAGLPEGNIPLLIEHANKVLADVDFGSSTVEVDAHFEGSIPKDLLMEFAEVNHLYGNGIPQPKFLFDLLISPQDFTTLGAKKTTLKIDRNGTEFIAFWASDYIEELSKIERNGLVRILGRPQVNEFRGRRNLQIVIDYLEVSEEEVSLF